jgi:hypothetical protein
MKINGFGYTDYSLTNTATQKNTQRASETNALAFDDQFQTTASTPKKTSTSTPQAPSSKWNVPSPETLKTSFQTWANDLQVNSQGIDFVTRVHTHAEAFEQLIDKAAANGGYTDPIAFIRGLSEQERAVLQHVHSLAKPIEPGTLTEEGALNLLLPRSELKDIDKDGYVMVGAAKTWFFPPVDASPEIRQAWEQASANLTEAERFTATGYFLPSPGQSAYLGDNLDAYRNLTAERLEGAKFAQQFDFSWQHEHRKKQIAFLTDFLSLLSAK